MLKNIYIYLRRKRRKKFVENIDKLIYDIRNELYCRKQQDVIIHWIDQMCYDETVGYSCQMKSRFHINGNRYSGLFKCNSRFEK